MPKFSTLMTISSELASCAVRCTGRTNLFMHKGYDLGKPVMIFKDPLVDPNPNKAADLVDVVYVDDTISIAFGDRYKKYCNVPVRQYINTVAPELGEVFRIMCYSRSREFDWHRGKKIGLPCLAMPYFEESGKFVVPRSFLYHYFGQFLYTPRVDFTPTYNIGSRSRFFICRITDEATKDQSSVRLYPQTGGRQDLKTKTPLLGAKGILRNKQMSPKLHIYKYKACNKDSQSVSIRFFRS